ncbi:flippase-like domain-containing protein [Vagococcus coleopterorum]|uniref:Phosphatidylglycerol lysyltransferase n=1 Tax=Vagococcus coleopterorum TaxID=2714946 RepID=A0A6G8AKU8_9ENTE|nr:lysylphosphatidylglycerol synthase transmembrane domain-containing protein [Vagococcus coleopterorum]QIL45626.1 flippase-like domain-containing protein [Vagococcus coleopterorum]
MNRKNRMYLIIASLLGVVVLGYQISRISLTSFFAELGNMKFGWLAVAVVCMLLRWVFEAIILQGLLKRRQGHYSFKNAMRVPLIEHLFNAITPFSTGGQPAQLLVLAKTGVDAGVAGSVCLMKFVVYQVMIVLNFIGCMIFGFQMIANEMRELSFFVVLGFGLNLIVVVVLLMLMYCYPLTSWLVDKTLKLLARFMSAEKLDKLAIETKEKMANFHEESQYMRKEPKVIGRAVFFTFVELVFYYLVPYFILLGLGVENVNPFQVIIFHAFIILVISLFPIPGGAGGAEYSFNLMFGTFMMTSSKMVVAVVLWRIITMYMGMVLGVIAMWVKPDMPEKIEQ